MNNSKLEMILRNETRDMYENNYSKRVPVDQLINEIEMALSFIANLDISDYQSSDEYKLSSNSTESSESDVVIL